MSDGVCELRMKVLIACEFSGIVRDAFKNRGHDAWSCDLLPTESEGNHIIGDVLKHLDDGWDLMIAHPPCTHLAVSGGRWFKDKQKEQIEAIDFFMALINAQIPKICVENPISVMSTKYRKPNQTIQPWQFGHTEYKATCLWLKGLTKLIPTCIVENKAIYKRWVTSKEEKIHHNVHLGFGFPWSSKECKQARSRTFEGIAEAMSKQWG